MSRPARLAPLARAEIARISADMSGNRRALARFRESLAHAARLIGDHPEIGHRNLALAGEQYRFWSLPGFPYLIVYRATNVPPLILRVLHGARELRPLLSDIADDGA